MTRPDGVAMVGATAAFDRLRELNSGDIPLRALVDCYSSEWDMASMGEKLALLITLSERDDLAPSVILRLIAAHYTNEGKSAMADVLSHTQGKLLDALLFCIIEPRAKCRVKSKAKRRTAAKKKSHVLPKPADCNASNQREDSEEYRQLVAGLAKLIVRSHRAKQAATEEAATGEEDEGQ